MTRAPPVLRDFSERLSPMVVKELRHGLRTPVFTLAFLLFHGLLIALMEWSKTGKGGLGDASVVFWLMTLTVLLGVMPLRGFGTLSAEARNGTLDLLWLTGISTFRVVLGKWAALYGQTLLLACSLVPYLLVRYQAGGVEMVREVAVLAVTLLFSAVLTAAHVGFSGQRSVVMRLVLGALTLGGAYLAGVNQQSLALEPWGQRLMMQMAQLSFWELAAWAAGLTVLAAYATYFFLALGVSRMAAATENHGTMKRLVMLAMPCGATALAMWIVAGGGQLPEVLPLFLLMLFLIIAAGADLFTEPMPVSPMVVMGLAARGRAGRALGWLLHPGWASGVMFYILLCCLEAAVLGAVWWSEKYSPGGAHSYRFVRPEIVMVSVCFLTAPVVPVCLRFFLRRDEFARWWIVQLLAAAAGMLIAQGARAAEMKELVFLCWLTPVSTVVGSISARMHELDDALLMGGAVTGLVWLGVAVLLALRQRGTYQRLEAEARMIRAGEKVRAGDAT